MKLLNGSDLAGYIKQRQQAQVRRLDTQPSLAIIQTKDDEVIDTFVRLKQAYGQDIGIETELHKIEQKQIESLIGQLNQDEAVTGIIVQLPLDDTSATDNIINLINSSKDVDALGKTPKFAAPTPTAILWLLAGYNIEFKGKNILLIGQGRLVGSPLKKMLDSSSIPSTVVDGNTKDLEKHCLKADVVISAAGQPGLLHSSMLKPGAIVVDAGTSSEDGKIRGDLADEVYEREDLTLTPRRGGVGPLTIAALFENVIIAAQQLK